MEVFLLQNILKKKSYNKVIFYTFITICFIVSVFFVYHNEEFYDRPIAEVIKTELTESNPVKDMYENDDHLSTQLITAVLKNGGEKGKLIHFTNEYSASGAFDQEYQVGNKLFVSIKASTDKNGDLTGTILDVKRDQFVLIVAWIFIFALLIVGKRQGLFSIISLIVNSLVLSFALDLYVHSIINLIFISGVCVLLFTIISLILINGLNEKTYAAIVATLLGTFISLLISFLVLWVTSENGLRYEEMQFLTRPYRVIFMAGLFIGALGAVMDVSITMASSMFALFEQNQDISDQALRTSGMDIGKDVMGTITSILFFVYISGSIPMLILYLKNSYPLGQTLSMNLSLELARALAGGIGVVLTIPISLYTSIFFINRKRAK
ncbi:yibE/F-like family protein [Lysinibacillus sp. KCTC 33748]|uniref:YibE/F family protein n=1 Tax=unclassified Lysinibacillus TaxID=2636778 RepID=UPI0009A78B9D|nr:MULTISPECIES: YibE/F family protein [unclassified Lysinibacillus]OXS76086.1 yibE/F-like family protein [Lysinibacillus sp. KCTC 33748]